MFQEIRKSTPFSCEHGSDHFLSCWLDIDYLSYVLPFHWSVDADIAESVWKGAVSVGDDDSVHDTFHTLVLSNEGGETGAGITAIKDDTEFILVCSFHQSWMSLAMNVRQAAAEPLDQTVFRHGPFVMTSPEEIQKTLIDCDHLVAPSCRGLLLTHPSRSNWQEWL